jgi:DNA phosphorothioation-dependent restriction protein DptG
MEQKCTACSGDGYTAEHGCGGDDRICSHTCPVQVQCETCKATGKVGVVAELTDEELRKAEEILRPFVNDHNEIIRWLRNQSPYEVAGALALALTDSYEQGVREGRKEGAKKVVEAVEEEDRLRPSFGGERFNKAARQAANDL